MRFSPDFIDKVRDANDVVDIISQYTTLKNAGNNLMGLCPFPDHREKTPSFSVSSTKQAYHCFGCKKGGNTITFLMEYNGMSFVEAIEYLANRASIPLPQNSSHSQKRNASDSSRVLHKLLKHAARFYQDRLQEMEKSGEVWSYIQKRGLSEETVQTFRMGYAPEEWSSFSNYLQRIKAPMEKALELGLLKQKNNYYDAFRGRLMFPIFSPKGDVVGFGGRALSEENSPKYLNSPESPVFHKGRILYGLHETAKYIRTEDSAILVEGYMDLVSLYQAGFKNVVATLGTALTEEHAKLLKRYTQSVIVLFDGDSAGVQAQERSLPILLSQGLLPKSIFLDPAKDPDEYIKKFGADSFREKLQKPQDLFFVLLDRVLEGYRETPTEKVEVINKLAGYLTSIVNNSLKDLYIQEVAFRMGVDGPWIHKALRSYEQQNHRSFQESVRKEASQEDVAQELEDSCFEDNLIKILNPPKEDLMLINLALHKEEFLQEFIEEKLWEKLEPSGLDQALRWIEKRYKPAKSQQEMSNFATLSSSLCDQVDKPSCVLWHLDDKTFVGTDLEKLKNDCLQRVRERFVDKQAKNALKQLRYNETPEKLEQFMNIMKSKLALKNHK